MPCWRLLVSLYGPLSAVERHLDGLSGASAVDATHLFAV